MYLSACVIYFSGWFKFHPIIILQHECHHLASITAAVVHSTVPLRTMLYLHPARHVHDTRHTCHMHAFCSTPLDEVLDYGTVNVYGTRYLYFNHRYEQRDRTH